MSAGAPCAMAWQRGAWARHAARALAQDDPDALARALHEPGAARALRGEPSGWSVGPQEHAPLALLCAAAHCDAPRCVAWLCANGFNPNEGCLGDPSGGTALHVASHADSAACARALARGGADIEARDASGLTPLLGALAAGSARAARELSDLGAKWSARSPRGSALDLAIDSGNQACVELALSLGIATAPGPDLSAWAPPLRLARAGGLFDGLGDPMAPEPNAGSTPIEPEPPRRPKP